MLIRRPPLHQTGPLYEKHGQLRALALGASCASRDPACARRARPRRPNSERLPDQLSGNHPLGRPPVFWLELEPARAGCPAPSRERPRQRWLAGHVAIAHACHAAGALRPQATLAGRTCSPARRPCLRAHKLAGAECNLKPSSGAARSAEGAVTLVMFHCSLLVFAGAIAHHPPTQQLSGDCVLARSAVV